MTGFRLPSPSDAADLALLPADGPVAAIVHEFLGIIGDYDAKWGEWDNSQPTYSAKLMVRTSTAGRLAVGFDGRRRANLKACTPGQIYVFDLDAYVNADYANTKSVRVLFEGVVYEVEIPRLWSSVEGVKKVHNLFGG